MINLASRHEAIQVEVKNLSKSGAKLMAPIHIQMECGEACTIDFILKNNKKHTRTGKIVWVSNDKTGHSIVFGVKFS